MVPDFVAYCGDSIAEGWRHFFVPCSSSGAEAFGLCNVMGPEGYQGVEAEQRRRGSQDGFIRPLSLGFDAEMGSGFLEGDFDLPSADEPGQD